MKILNKTIFLSAYSNYQQQLVKEYEKALRLRNKGYQLSKIIKKTGISIGRLQHWFYHHKVPYPLKSIKFLKNKKLIPLTSNSSGFETILKIFAWSFGDGTIGKRDYYICLTGQKKDLEKLADEIRNELEFKTRITKVKFKDRESAFHLEIQGNGNRILGRLMAAIGAPCGDKVTQTFYLPNWLMKAPKWVKIGFLDVLFANEIKAPCMQKRKIASISGLDFRMQKSKCLMKYHLRFLNQIRELLNELYIQTSVAKSCNNDYTRKDGIISQTAGFRILTNQINFIKFSNIFKFEFCDYKKEILKELTKKVINRVDNEIKMIKLYREVIKIKETNNSFVKVATMKGLPKSRVKSWFEGNKPRFYDIEKEVNECLKNGM
jgi:tRNA-splicing ligase RtcB